MSKFKEGGIVPASSDSDKYFIPMIPTNEHLFTKKQAKELYLAVGHTEEDFEKWWQGLESYE